MVENHVLEIPYIKDLAVGPLGSQALSGLSAFGAAGLPRIHLVLQAPRAAGVKASLVVRARLP